MTIRITYETLIAYAAGELSAAELSAVEAHLAVDPRAEATVRMYRDAKAAAAIPPSAEPPPEVVARAKAIFRPAAAEAPAWWQVVERIVAELVFDSRLQPALAGFRGHERGFQLSFESAPVSIDLQAEPIDHPGIFDADDLDEDSLTWSVMGQIESSLLEPGCAVALVCPGAVVATAQSRADRHGIFSMEAPAGRYDLHIRHAEGNLVLPNIDMA